jgi:hypothetical protein
MTLRQADLEGRGFKSLTASKYSPRIDPSSPASSQLSGRLESRDIHGPILALAPTARGTVAAFLFLD